MDVALFDYDRVVRFGVIGWVALDPDFSKTSIIVKKVSSFAIKKIVDVTAALVVTGTLTMLTYFTAKNPYLVARFAAADHSYCD